MHGKALWYLTRGTGVVTLLLLTVSLALGIVQSVRWKGRALPRFVTSAIHRNASLLSVVFLVVHIVTAIADGYVPIRWIDAVVPFRAAYRPIWLGLGTVASNILLALVITSLLRQRIGYRVWKVVHWAAYACWPIALVHGLGTGSDTRYTWNLALDAVSVAVVLLALWWRLAAVSPAFARIRLAGLAATVVVPVVVAVWLVVGPLAPHWSKRAAIGPAPIAGVAVTVDPRSYTSVSASVSASVRSVIR